MNNIKTAITLDEPEILSSSEWKMRKQVHEEKLSPILDPYLKRRSQQLKDPVLDFLFEYYKFRPSHLMRWSPGVGTHLKLDGSTPYSDLPEISEIEINIDGSSAYLDTSLFPEKLQKSTRWIYELLTKTNTSKPFFGCMGMHEWAMVYKAGQVRHSQVPLRLPDEEIAEIVESRPLLCTHFDAFRFFTDEAKPLNKNHLSRESFQNNEQPGCIHTNMDIYKWAYKRYPWISGDIIADAFLLAVDSRTIDMKASPYDLRSRGLEPIKIETEAGRKKYIKHQTEIWEKGKQLRQKLIREYENLFSHFTFT